MNDSVPSARRVSATVLLSVAERAEPHGYGLLVKLARRGAVGLDSGARSRGEYCSQEKDS